MASRKASAADPAPDSRLAELAQALSLTSLARQLDDLLAQAEKGSFSYTDFALLLLRTELDARLERKCQRSVKLARLGPVEGLEGFDWSLRPRLGARVVKELLNCRWASEHRNVIAVGRPGTGKTRVLKAISHAACMAGYSVRYVITAEMLEEIHGALADGTYKRVMRRYTKPAVLCCDEFAYEPLDAEATSYLFRVVSARHGVGSTLLAANTGFKNWQRLFPSQAHAVATVDRLIDQATILRFTGRSYRKPKDIHGAELDDDHPPD